MTGSLSLWRNEVTPNPLNNGIQGEPKTVQLANGNFLVAWEDAGNNYESSNGYDIVGQLYDSLQNAIGSPFRVNSNFNADDEQDFDLAPLDDGGFVVVYEDTDMNGTSIRATEWNADATISTDRTILAAPGADDLYKPSIATGSDGKYLVSYNRSGSSIFDTYTVLVDPVAGTVGAPVATILNNFGAVTEENVVAALSNGQYVVVNQFRSPTDNAVAFRRVGAGGTPIGGASFVGNTDTNGGDDFDVDVVGLSGGGFVVAWSNEDGNDIDVQFQIYDNLGVAQGGVVNVETLFGSQTDDSNEVSLAAFDDCFILIYDDDENNQLVIERFDFTGRPLGGSVALHTNNVTQPDVLALEDGRFVLAWNDFSDIVTQVWDRRDNANTVPVYTPDDYKIGTVGPDTFSADADVNHGWDGDDTISEALGNGVIFGDGGNDVVISNQLIGIDTFYGGSGSDTLDYTALDNVAYPPDVSFDLLGEKVSAVGSTTLFDTVINFENVIGSNGNNRFLGTNVSNSFTGGTGNDLMFGRSGDDILIGNSGGDVLNGGGDADELIGGNGQDIIRGQAGDDLLIGVEPTDLMPGFGERDRMLGGIDADIFVIGDAINIYYLGSGNADYGDIRDFNLAENDLIQLNGSSADYSLQVFGGDTRVFHDNGSSTDLVAIARGVVFSDFSSGFSFV